MGSFHPPEYLPCFDAEGFLLDPRDWSEACASRLARLDGLGELGPRQWSVIRTLRQEYHLMHGLPAPHHTCRLAGYGPDCMESLFHGAREAWRLAGLPDPGDEARAYM